MRKISKPALGPSTRLLEGRSLFLFLRQLLAGQDGIDAPDRGDHDLRFVVEARRAELLDVVDFGKRPSGAGRPVREIFIARLAHEIGAVGQKQDTLEPGMRQQPVAQRAGGEGLAGAGRHLH